MACYYSYFYRIAVRFSFRHCFAFQLAYAALKAYKEKAERSKKAEKEELLRIRKQCTFVARMVRDWWRQMDKVMMGFYAQIFFWLVSIFITFPVWLFKFALAQYASCIQMPILYSFFKNNCDG